MNGLAFAGPIAFAVLVWWGSTACLLYLDNLPQRTFRRSMAGASVVFCLAVLGLFLTKNIATVTGAYFAFGCGVLAWGWQEASFYLGYVTGPRRMSCAAGCAGWRHFGHALGVSLYHEIAIILSAGVICLATLGGVNGVGLATFLILWGMHESARLNVFLGVRNISADFLPAHLVYLRSFLRKKPVNLLFPVSVTISTSVAVLLFRAASTATLPQVKIGDELLGSLMVLAILEHWFLILPLPLDALWSWVLRFSRTTPAQPVPAAAVTSVASHNVVPLPRIAVRSNKVKSRSQIDDNIGPDETGAAIHHSAASGKA